MTGRRVVYNASTPGCYRVRLAAIFLLTPYRPLTLPGSDIPTSTRDAVVLGSGDGAAGSSGTGCSYVGSRRRSLLRSLALAWGTTAFQKDRW